MKMCYYSINDNNLRMLRLHYAVIIYTSRWHSGCYYGMVSAAASDAMIESQLVDTISSLLTQELLPEVMCNVLTLTHSLIMTRE